MYRFLSPASILLWAQIYLLAFDAELCRAVRRVLLRAVFGSYASAA